MTFHLEYNILTETLEFKIIYSLTFAFQSIHSINEIMYHIGVSIFLPSSSIRTFRNSICMSRRTSIRINKIPSSLSFSPFSKICHPIQVIYSHLFVITRSSRACEHRGHSSQLGVRTTPWFMVNILLSHHGYISRSLTTEITILSARFHSLMYFRAKTISCSASCIQFEANFSLRSIK